MTHNKNEPILCGDETLGKTISTEEYYTQKYGSRENSDFAPYPDPPLRRGDRVMALEDLDPEGANVKAGERGTCFEEPNFYGDWCGPMVRWDSGGCCNVYAGQIRHLTKDDYETDDD